MPKPRGRKAGRARAKRSTVPKIQPGDAVVCKVPGEQLESVLVCYDQLTQSVLPVHMAVVVRENRATARKFVDAFLALILPILVDLLGEAAGARGIAATDPRWPEFQLLAAEHRTEVSKMKLYTISLTALVAEKDVRMSSSALDLLVEIGAILDDR